MSGVRLVTNPFAQTAATYIKLGWHPIWLPPKEKWPPPAGTTGWNGKDVTAAQALKVAKSMPDANIGLRLNDGVLGIDVDAYGDKAGGKTLRELEKKLGKLPPTVRLTSRDDGISGIYLFRVPVGQTWPSQFGPGIEAIHMGHRYAVAWPSVHPAGGTYHFVDADGNKLDHVPCRPDDLADLTQAWVDAFAGTYTAAPVRDTSVDLGRFEPANGDPCERIDFAVDKALGSLSQHGSRHDSFRDAQLAVVQLGDAGHRGAAEALTRLREVFVAEVSDRERDGEAEWERMLEGAIERAEQVERAECDGQDCFQDYSRGILMPGTGQGGDSRGATGSRTASPGATKGSGFDVLSEAETDSAEDAPSWQPVDLAEVLAEGWQREMPSLMPLTDSSGMHLLYRGRLHSMHGESESGKSFVIQLEAARIVKAGGDVLYIDQEADAGAVANRMREMGAAADAIVQHFHYVQPERPPLDPDEAAAFARILRSRYDLIVWDGVTDALGLFRASSRDENEVRRFMRFARMLTKTGAAVVIIDHVSKDKENRGRFALGSQHKMAALDGAAYIVDVEQPIAPGQLGVIHLRVGKDRPGSVRAMCDPKTKRRSDRTHLAAVVTIDSRHEAIQFSLRRGAADDLDQDHTAEEPKSTPPRFAYGPLAEKVSNTLGEAGPMTRTRLAEVVGRRSGNGNAQFNAVVDDLVQEGFVSADASGKYVQLVNRRLFVLANETLMKETGS